MTENKRIQIGIIGAKFAGSFHADMWAQMHNAEVAAIADLDDAARMDYKTKYSVNRDYKTYEELVADPDVDVVDICLPNFLHAKVAIAAMEAGKDVICEKPIATTEEDAALVVEAQRRTGKRYFYAEDWIFAPPLVRAREIIEEGGIGTVLYCKGKESHNGSHSPFAQTIEFCGGGATLHLGIHAAGFFYDLFGMPDSIVGVCTDGLEGNFVHKKMEGEDWGIGVLTYSNGPRVVLEGNYITTGGMDDVIEFYGTEGVLKVDLTFGGPLSVYSRPGFEYAVEKADTTKGWTKPAVKESEALGYKDEMTHFLDCIEGRAEQNKGTTAEAGFNALKIIKTLYRSHKEKRTITIE